VSFGPLSLSDRRGAEVVHGVVSDPDVEAFTGVADVEAGTEPVSVADEEVG